MKNLKYIISCLLIIFISQTATTSVSAEEVSSNSAAYDEVYTGLLPDHPLYFLKVTRDNLVSFFKGKPLEKADFALLQADKQFAATHILITQKNDPELASGTLASGQQHLEDAITQAKAAQKEGMNIKELSERINKATKRHSLALKELEQSLRSQDQEKYNQAKQRAEQISSLSAALLNN